MIICEGLIKNENKNKNKKESKNKKWDQRLNSFKWWKMMLVQRQQFKEYVVLF